MMEDRVAALAGRFGETDERTLEAKARLGELKSTYSPVFDIFSNAVLAAPALFPICATASSTFIALDHRTFAAFPASALPNRLDMLVPVSYACSSRMLNTSIIGGGSDAERG